MEILNTIILLGAIQGLILSAVLFFSKAHPGTKFLAGFIFVLAYNGIETYNWTSGLDFAFFSLFPFVVIFGAGPCLYFYSKSLIEPDQRSDTRHVLRHFIPVLVFGTFRIAMFALHWYALSREHALAPTLYEIEMWFILISEPLSFTAFVCYVAVSWRYFRSFRLRVQTPLSPQEILATTWARRLLYCVWGVAVAWILTIVIPRLFEFDDLSDPHYYPIELSLVVLIYWITFSGYHRTKIIHQKSSKPQNVIDTAVALKGEALLRNAMAVDKLYLDPELTVAKVSEHIGMPTKTISAVINQHLGQSFNDFINSYRVAEVKQRLLSQDQHLTIAGIALDCGFNSQATFQRAFKNTTKVSPKEFIAQRENQVSALK